MPQLVLPSAKYQASFLQAVTEYQAEQLAHYKPLKVEELAADFSRYVDRIKRESRGDGLPEDQVPHTEYWLVEGNEFIGRVNLRHHLNSQLQQVGGHISYDVRPSQRRKGYGKLALELGLAKAKELGIEEVLITCDVNNIGSGKIIQANGGILQDIKPMGTGKPDKAKYKIALK